MANIRNHLPKALLNRGRATALRAISLAAAVLGAPGFASETVPAAPSGSQNEQLDEVLVDGRRLLRNARVALDWLQRLVGDFAVDGRVDLHGLNSTDVPVQGRATCFGLGPAPSVLCELNISWPQVQGTDGEVFTAVTPNLSPAILMFGFEPTRAGIHHMFVGNDGVADGALGYLLSEDSLVARANCGGVRGACERLVRFTAQPDGTAVKVEIDLEIDRRRTFTIAFGMHRRPTILSDTVPGR